MQHLIASLMILLAASVVSASGGGGGEAQEPAADGESAAGKEEAEQASLYLKKQAEVTSLEGRVKEGRAAILKMIREKNAIADRKEKQKAVEALVERHRQLQTDIEKYNTARAELRFKFPGKAEATDRKYIPWRTQSIEQIEEGMGLEADLNRVRAEIDKKYAPFTKNQNDAEADPALRTPTPSDRAPAQAEPPRRLRLEK